MARRPFVPKPFEPGATISWTHFTNHGPVEVEGVVVCGAPSVAGNRTMWVQPTTAGFSEVYSLVPVVKVARERFYFHRPFATGPMVMSAGHGRKGECVSSGVLNTETYWMMRAAWEHGESVKASSPSTEPETAVAA